MRTKILYHHRLQVCAALIAADCLVFTMVDPHSASASWLIAGYSLLGTTLFSITNLLADSLRSYGERPYKIGKRFLQYAATILVATIGLQSIGQLTIRDVVTMLPVVVIAYLYFGYGKKFVLDSP